MHPRTAELLRHLDENRDALRAAVDAVPVALRETRPSPDVWSVAEVLEHLTRVEQQITRALAGKLSEAEAAGQLLPQPETTPISGLLDHDAILDRRRRVTAGERVLPRGDTDSATSLTALDGTRVTLRDLVTRVGGLTLDTFMLPHPVLGTINGYQWFLFIGSHEARHAAQIREIGTAIAVR